MARATESARAKDRGQANLPQCLLILRSAVRPGNGLPLAWAPGLAYNGPKTADFSPDRPTIWRTAMRPHCNRREFLKVAAGTSLLAPLVSRPLCAATRKPTWPVAVARCKSYDLNALLREMQTMMDQLGGLSKLVAGKTVTV